MMPFPNQHNLTRQPAVAGLFYPGDPSDLRALLRRLLEAARGPSDLRPAALIVPHAGYVYSGAVAAAAFAAIAPRAAEIERVVLIGPAHTVAFDGIAAPRAQAFATPLGEVPLDVAGISALVDEGLLIIDAAAHAREHALEVEVPFLQLVLKDYVLLPLVVGSARPEAVSKVLLRLWDAHTLVVVSSDLSHYLDYETAQRRDAKTAAAIERLDDAAIGSEDACGFLALRGLLGAVRRRGLRAHRLELCNSADTAGDRHRVVGYGAWAIVRPEDNGASAHPVG
jgi:AmmeMemoRadiSam system protein B